jgi:hypothetical protein
MLRGSSANIVKGKGFVYVEMVGCDVGGVDRSDSFVNVTPMFLGYGSVH